MIFEDKEILIAFNDYVNSNAKIRFYKLDIFEKRHDLDNKKNFFEIKFENSWLNNHNILKLDEDLIVLGCN